MDQKQKLNFVYQGITLLEEHIKVSERTNKSDSLINLHPPPDSCIPTALLPLYEFENVISGTSVDFHRRGKGWDFPLESRVSTANNNTINCGRVPLIPAFKSYVHKKWGENQKSRFSWTPFKDPIYINAEDIISETIASINQHQNTTITIVVPDGINETGQDTLCRALKKHPSLRYKKCYLLSKSMAAILGLQNDQFFTSLPNEDETILGHMRLFSLGMDTWSISFIEISTKKTDHGTFIVPYLDLSNTVHLPLSGFDLLLGYVYIQLDRKMPLNIAWNHLIGTNKALKGLFENRLAQKEIWALLNEKDFRYEIEKLSHDLPHCSALNHKLHEFNRSFEEGIRKLEKQINKSSAPIKRCIGNVFQGLWSEFYVDEKNTLKNYIQKRSPSPSPLVSNSFSHLTAQGAVNFSYRVENDLPTYYEKLVPIDIYYKSEDENKDEVIRWLPLVDSTKVQGGKLFERKNISGLSIPRGHTKLKLVLRRPETSDSQGLYFYKEIIGIIPDSFDTNEEVKLHLSLKPGQGYAQVCIESVNDDLFTAELDWETMKNCQEPKISKLRYIRQTVTLRPCVTLWKKTEGLITDLTVLSKDIKNNKAQIIQVLDEIRDILNKKKRSYSKDPLDHQFYLDSAIGSNGKTRNSLQLKDLHNEMEKIWNSQEKDIDPTFREKIIRVCSWMYLAAPSSVLCEVKNSTLNPDPDIPASKLQLIGCCFYEKNVIKWFYQSIIIRLSTSLEKSTNWLRCLSNIIKFRQDTLSYEYIDDNQINQLTTLLVNLFEQSLDKKDLKKRFTCLLWVLLFLLKRRRYEIKFLAIDGPLGSQLNNLIEKTLSQKLTPMQRELLKSILKFLNEKGSEEDEMGALKLIENEEES
jgi:hypothetical protein